MIRFAALVVALGLMGCAATTGDGTESSAADISAADAPLKMNQLQTKGTHNSYHRARWFFPSADLDYNFAPLDEQLESQGVRAFELDLHFEDGHFDVHHVKWDEGSTCPKLTDCLKTLKKWSDAHPTHEPLFIQLETKDGFDLAKADAYHAELDKEILSVWPKNRIVTPDDVKGSAASVRDAITTTGWPTMDSARGKIVFYLETDAAHVTNYTHGDRDLDGRLSFVGSSLNHPYAAIAIMDDPIAQATAIQQAVKQGFIIRTRADADLKEPKKNDTSREAAAFASGAQIVSTDFPAKDPNYAYIVHVPGGDPSRCNPLNAPAGCVADDVEAR